MVSVIDLLLTKDLSEVGLPLLTVPLPFFGLDLFPLRIRLFVCVFVLVRWLPLWLYWDVPFSFFGYLCCLFRGAVDSR